MAIPGPTFHQENDEQIDPFEELKRMQKELLAQYKRDQKAKRDETKHLQQKASPYHDKHNRGRTPKNSRY